MSSFIPVSQFVSVSVSTPPTGLRSFAVNNLAIFTKTVPLNEDITATNPGIYVSPGDVATDWGATSEEYYQAVFVFSQTPNILDGRGQLIIFPMGSGDTLAAAIPAGALVTFFGGCMWAGQTPNDAAVLAASTAVASLQGVKLFVSSYLAASATPSTGLFSVIKDASQHHTRCFYYGVGFSGGAADAFSARIAMACYAGRAMSTNFEGVDTTATMHGKTLTGILPDTSVSTTVLAALKVAGADSYPSVGGGAQYLGKVFCTSGNDYWDNVYNLDWIVSAIQVAGFNALTQTATKLPQTEPGMAVLKGAYNTVLLQAVTNGFVAPGVWNSPQLFGNPNDLKRCVLNTGFYLYSQPVNQQSQTAREAREAPLVQIAIKFAGAIQQSSVIVYINQ